MDKRERFDAVIAGEQADRPPVGCWIHFGSALWEPADSATAHVRFYREYDWDYVKVMNDYRLATPDGLDEAPSADYLRGVGAADLTYPGFARQLEVLRLIGEQAPEAPRLDTMFSPLQTVIRCLGQTVVPQFQADPELARMVLGQVTDRLVEYVAALKEAGVEGLFLSINGASHDATGWGISAQEFTDWVAPFDRQVLTAAEGLTRVIHVHGYDLAPELVADYPAEVLSWSNNQTRPSVAEVAASDRVPLAGLDEVASLYWPPSLVAENIAAVRQQAADRLILGPGCTVHSDTPPAVLRALRAGAEAGAAR
ncbi:uroporphyrinogen decarboxylase [Enemella dayhoffiae]|uniref:Uroporphyrinogen decarboxylase n=1 Tax=Enemella dayhoffiae TaxID=2016507 RepID=A0A255GRC1_9ACTN|nr:uroporphyrinogen decarboxylase family protein [Enemella dayhoffiae]OYO18367.1 uroporphyrinogen decarboxylase [Enemella dayhoffiae]